jgi:hypothetical protein
LALVSDNSVVSGFRPIVCVSTVSAYSGFPDTAQLAFCPLPKNFRFVFSDFVIFIQVMERGESPVGKKILGSCLRHVELTSEAFLTVCTPITVCLFSLYQKN